MKSLYCLFVTAIIFTGASGDSGRIIGGQNASEGAFPYMAAVWTRASPTDFSFCGGAILNEYWVLSAAHCGAATFITTGSNNLTNQEYQYTIMTRIKFNYDNVTHKNDIQLLRTFRKIVMVAGKVAPISIYTGSVPNDSPLLLSGWGLWTSTQQPVYLQVLNYTYVNQSSCVFYNNMSPSKRDYFENIDMCAMPGIRTGACFGDSGGPLVYKGAVVGVVSRLMAMSCSCGYPDIFANVPYFASKIAGVISK